MGSSSKQFVSIMPQDSLYLTKKKVQPEFEKHDLVAQRRNIGKGRAHKRKKLFQFKNFINLERTLTLKVI